jgi:phytoene/squalene synthetase
MPPDPPKPRGIRNFFTRLRNLLSKLRPTRTDKIRPQDTTQPIPARTDDGTPSRQSVATEPRREAERVVERERRIEILRKIEEEARLERESLVELNAAQRPPVADLETFERRKGFRYDTWFKAFGTFGETREVGDSPTLLGEQEELDDYSVPAAFYSSGVLGKVKWTGRILSRDEVIAELNSVAAWYPDDFRDVYPRWEYRYYVAEMVGDVTVAVYEHKAKQPLDARDEARGWKNA